MPSFEAHPDVEVLVPRASDHRCTIATVHESRRFDRVRITEARGHRCVALPFAVGQVAPGLTTSRLAWVVEQLVDGRRLRIAGLRLAHEILSVGNPGYGGLRSVLDEWNDEAAIAESALERRFLTVAGEFGLPLFQQQVDVLWRGHARHRVDFVWPDARIIIEVDGRRWHGRRRDFDRDRRRDLDAASEGWMVIRLTWWMLERDPIGVCERLLDARRKRLAA